MRKNKTKAEIQFELEQAKQRIAELESASERDSEERFSRVFDASPAQMALTDLKTGQYVEVNEAFLQTLGFAREEVLGRTALELNLFSAPAQRAELLQRMGQQGYLRDEYVQVRAKSGELRHGVFSAEYLQSNGQKFLLTVMNDITEWRRAEERWQFALEGAGDGVWDWNPQTNQVFYSAQWKQMLGYDEDEIGDTLDEWASRVHPDDFAQTMEKVNAHLAGETPIYFSEHRLLCKDGTYKWILDRGKVIEWTEARKPLRVIGTHKDVTERREVEEKLRKSEQQYQSLIETLDISLCRWLPDTTLTYANEKYKKIFGVQGEAVGKKWLSFLPDETRATTAIFYSEVAKNPRAVTYEHPVTVEDGSSREFQWVDTPILNEQGEVLEFQSVGIDIHERKLGERAIQENEARLQGILEATPDTMVIIAPDGKILMANVQTEKTFGYSRQELLGMCVENLIPASLRLLHLENRQQYMARPRTVTTGVEHDIFALRKNGETFPAEISLSYHQRANGEAMVLCAIRDVTEQKRVRELIAAQRDLARLNGASLPPEEVWQACLQVALDVSGLDCGGIYLLNEHTRAYELVKHHGLGPAFAAQNFRYEKDADTVQMFLTGQPSYLDLTDLYFQRATAEEGIRAAAFLPLQFQEKIVGCLAVASHSLPCIPDEVRVAMETIALEIGNILVHQQTEEALKVSRNQLSQALVAARMGTWRLHVPTNQIEWSPEAAQIFGVELTSNDFGKVLEKCHPDDRPRLVQSIQTSLAQKRMTQLEFRFLNAQDKPLWVTNFGNIEYDAEGKPLMVTGVIQDITEQKLAQNALIAREKQLKTIVDSQTHFMIRVNMEGKYTYWNAQFEKEFGWLFEPHGIQDALVFNSVCDYHHQRMIEVVAKCMANPGQVFSVEIDKPARDGGVCNTLWEFICLTDEQNQPVEMQCMGIDITDRKKTEQDLSDSEELYRLTLSYISDAVLITNPAGEFTFVCPNVDTLFGYTQAEVKQTGNIVSLLGKEIFNPEDLEQSGELRNIEYTLTDKWGGLHDVLVTIKRIDLKGGTALYTFHDVSERKQAEQHLRESEERFRSFIEQSTDGLMLLDEQGRIVEWNQAQSQITGFTREQALNMKIWDLQTLLLPPERRAQLPVSHLQEIYQEMASNPHTDWYKSLESTEIETLQGERRFVQQNAFPIQTPSLTRVGAVLRDITAQKRAQEAQRETDERYHLLFQMMTQGITFQDRTGRLIDANPAAERIIGMSLKELLGRTTSSPAWRLIHEDGSEIPEEETPTNLVLQTGQPVYGKVIGVFNPLKQAYMWLNMNVVPRFMDGETVPYQLFTIFEDITERKQKDDALRESEAKYRSLIDSQESAISTIDAEGVFHYINGNGAAPFGSPDFVVGKKLQDLFPPRIADWQLTRVRQAIETGKGFVEEYPSALAGQLSWRRVSIQPILRSDGTVQLATVNSLDITERKRAEEELRLAEQRYRALIENAPDGIILVGPDGKFTYASPTAQKLTGYSQAELQQMDPVAMTHPSEVALVLEELDHVLRNPSYTPTLQYRYQNRQGEWRWVESTYSNLLALSSVAAIIINFRDITERKLAEEALKRSQELLKEAQRIGQIGYMEWNRSTQALICSDEIYDIFGVSPDTPISKNLIDSMMKPGERERLKELDHHAIQQRMDMNYEYTIHTRHGKDRWVHQLGKTTYADDGKPIRMMMIVQDVTERKQAEVALRASEEKYRGLIESLDSIVATIDAQGTFLYMNDLAAMSIGQHAHDLIGKTMFDIFPEAYATQQMVAIRQVIQEDQAYVFESQSELQGALRWYRTSIQPIHDESGQVSHVLLNTTDIDNLKSIQHELETLNRTLEEKVNQRTAEVQDLYDNAPVGYYSLNADGVITAINQTALTWLGYPREELLGSLVTSMFAIEDSQAFFQDFEQFKIAKTRSNLELMARRKDGSTFPVMLNAIAIYDENGQYISSRTTLTDITQLKLAENELKRNINFTNALLDAIPTPVFYKDRHGNYQGCNRAFTEIMGKTAEQVQGKSVYELWPGANARIYHQRDLELMERGTQQVYESTVYDKDGRDRPVIFVKDIFHDESGKVAGLVGAFIDITERKQAEDALRLANTEMERAIRLKDEFLASMSHELRTPLNAILGLSESLIEQIIGPLNERQLYSLQTIEQSGRHLLELINDILDLSKLESNQMTLDLAPVVVQEMCEASLIFIKEIARKKYLQVMFKPDPAVGSMQADGRRLKQMLVNLLSNAVKFTPEGGAIELQVIGNVIRRTVSFSVTDTGIGIASENLPRLFQPFVQLDSGLNRQFEGTGLGLALVASMAKLHGGTVSVESEPGRGSRFTITLPWTEPAASPVSAAELFPRPVPPPPSVPAFGSGPLILIAEDNEANVITLSVYLQAMGYRVAIAHNGLEALNHARFKRPALILMDLQMPVLNGLEAIRHLRQDNEPEIAQIPVIALTALAMPADRERSLEAGADAYLSKPVNLKQLNELINHLVKEK